MFKRTRGSTVALLMRAQHLWRRVSSRALRGQRIAERATGVEVDQTRLVRVTDDDDLRNLETGRWRERDR